MEARNLKSREYNTHITEHQPAGYDMRVRNHNTWQAEAGNVKADDRARNLSASKRQSIFKPGVDYRDEVQRASYQDSNPLMNRDTTAGYIHGTVQKTAIDPNMDIKMRASNTFKSSVFGESQENQQQSFGGVRVRDHNTWQSSAFHGPVNDPSCIVEAKGRQVLGGQSHGSETLFGDAQKDFNQSSKNPAIVNNGTQQESVVNQGYEPHDPRDAMAAKARELYGESAQRYGISGQRRAPDLSASVTDWKNTHASAWEHNPAARANVEDGANRKDRKYQELQSDVFGGNYAPSRYDVDQPRNAFASNADWKTQGGHAKPQNELRAVDTFAQRQSQLASQALPQTDYAARAPAARPVGFSEHGDGKEAPLFSRRPDEVLRAGHARQEPQRKDYGGYDAREQKVHNIYASALGGEAARPTREEQPAIAEKVPASFVIDGRETRATTQAYLASSTFEGASSLEGYDKGASSDPQVVDLVLSGLPASMEVRDLRRLAGAKHVVSAELDEDNFRGICKGTGRIQLRLNQGESADQVRLNYIRAGYSVRDFAQDPRKKPVVTGQPKEFAHEIEQPAVAKQDILRTTMPDAFGNTGSYRPYPSARGDGVF